jgi:hypothetical protein
VSSGFIVSAFAEFPRVLMSLRLRLREFLVAIAISILVWPIMALRQKPGSSPTSYNPAGGAASAESDNYCGHGDRFTSSRARYSRDQYNGGIKPSDFRI